MTSFVAEGRPWPLEMDDDCCNFTVTYSLTACRWSATQQNLHLEISFSRGLHHVCTVGINGMSPSRWRPCTRVGTHCISPDAEFWERPPLTHARPSRWWRRPRRAGSLDSDSIWRTRTPLSGAHLPLSHQHCPSHLKGEFLGCG